TGRPRVSILPAAGVSSPATTLSNDDLPQPVGPTIAVNCPRGMEKLISRMAWNVPKCTRMASISTATVMGLDCGSLLPRGPLARQHLIHHPVCARARDPSAGTLSCSVQLIDYRLNEGLLDVKRVFYGEFLPALTRGKDDRGGIESRERYLTLRPHNFGQVH